MRETHGRIQGRKGQESLKVCSRCKVEKPADRDHFSFIASKGKWHAWCKPCCAEDRRRDRAENPERYRLVDSKRDPEKVNAQQRARRQANPEHFRAFVRNRTPEQKARYNLNRRLKLLNDPEHAAKVRRQRAEGRARNGEKYSAQRREAWRKATPARRLRAYFTSAICHSLKGTTKGGRSWEAILGYTTADLRAHLERQFTKGMTWDNYGQWHVDHIIPVATFSFDSPDDDEFKACWSLTNLRPLWAQENMRRGRSRSLLL